MVSSCFFSRKLLNRLAIAACAVAITLLPFTAQALPGTTPEGGHQYSSSSDWRATLTSFDATGTPGGKASGQYGQYGKNNRYPNYQSRWSHLAFEVGGGLTTPIGNASNNKYETYGYNFTMGAGWNFNKHFGVLLEYQFNKNKIPGATLAAAGFPGGNINTHSLIVEPVYYQPITHTVGVYGLAGSGFYRKVTNFTAPQQVTQCYYFCYTGYANQTVANFSSIQAGYDVGGGVYWKAFGEDSNAKLYAEARYKWVDSPKPTATQDGEGTETLIPVTVGVRW
ncbi:MAG TPA: hypothetical protein VMU92_02580 [Acidobacteriaceae bacterium]|nr:hypothetical protein [Acidobacteriaceae bacterium]